YGIDERGEAEYRVADPGEVIFPKDGDVLQVSDEEPFVFSSHPLTEPEWEWYPHPGFAGGHQVVRANMPPDFVHAAR
ncbi:MAG TPA: hypothetical protein DF383_10745, partial [Deltaproteobacteria bacterium]|nr:hypothetical protein [Deltaproteobacteria bacterium]